MLSSIRLMSIKEFVEEGYLQEMNRKFLHPLGLAISVKLDEATGIYEFGEIFDARDDPEGYSFDEKLIQEKLEIFKLKADNVDKQLKKHAKARRKLFKRKVIQPLDLNENIT